MIKKLTIIILTIYSCANEQKELTLKRYFFPYNELKDPKIYIYKINDGTYTYNEYYHLMSDGKHIIVKVFNNEYKLVSFMIDRITDEGILLYEQRSITNNTFNKAIIYNPIIFPFNKNTPVNCTIIINEQKTILNLYFQTIDKYFYNDKEIPCAIFYSKITTNDNLQLTSTIFYSYNLGITKEIITHKEKTITKTLDTIITEKYFNKLKTIYNQGNAL